MKFNKKILVPATAIMASSAIFAGCSGNSTTEELNKDTLFVDAVKAMKDKESVGMKSDIDMDLKLGSSGFYITVGVDGDMDIEGDLKNEIIHAKGDFEMDALGQDQKIQSESYVAQEDNYTVTYSSQTTSDAADKQWSYTKKESGDFNWLKAVSSVEVKDEEFKKNLNDYTKNLKLSSETEKVDGRDCYVVSGIFSVDNSMADNLPTGVSSIAASDKIDIDSIWYFAKDSHELKKVELDFANAIKDIKTEGQDFSIDPEECKVTVDFTYGEKYNLSIPEDVKNNAKEGVDSTNAIELMTQI